MSIYWQNWGQNVTATPEHIFRPKTKDSIINIINNARTEKKRIRAVGSGHTWSPLAKSNEYMVSLEHFTAISLRDDRCAVTVEAGVTVDQLAAFLIEHQVALPTNVGHGVGECHYGGVVSTGCHGSGIQLNSTSDYAIAFEIIDANGEVRTFDESSGEDLLNAVRISLGLFGMITSITFRVEPEFNVHVEEFKWPVTTTLEQVKDIVLDNDYAEVSWMPFNKDCWVQRANRTQDAVTRVGFDPPQSKNEFWEQLMQVGSALALDTLVNSPEQTPDMMQTSFALLRPDDYVSNITDYLHNADYTPLLQYKVLDIEVCFDIDEEFDSVRKAFAICQMVTERWASQGLYPFNGTLGFRFIKNSNATLSAARGNRWTGLVELSSYYKTDLFEEFAGEVCELFMQQLPNARPHWAKGFQFMPHAVSLIQESFGEQLTEFLQQREAANVDPDNLFANEMTARIFDLK